MQGKPILIIDIDGIGSLGGSPPNDRPAGAVDNVDAVMHSLSCDAGIHLLARHVRFAPAAIDAAGGPPP
jgi:hypothetical protein